MVRRIGAVDRLVRGLHATTREDIVRRFLILSPGQPCDELRRAESERILRAQPFLVDARIQAYDDGRGGIVLEVESRDELSLVFALAARTAAPGVTRLRLGEANLMGRGVYAAGEWFHGGVGYRDGVGARVMHYQLFGRPYQLGAQALRRQIGGEWAVNLAHPFFTDLQRVAWRTSLGGVDEHLNLVRGAEPQNALFYRQRFADVGGLLRVGLPGRLSLFGASLSREASETANRVAIASDTGIVADGGRPLGFDPSERYPGQHATRLNLLWGVRNIRFLRVAGFDALTGVQDVRRGFQAGTLFGRSSSLLGSRDDDLFVSGDLYLGGGTPRSFVGLELAGEGRQDYDRDRWDGVVAGGRGAWYLVPGARWRLVTSVEYDGTWRPRVPAQLQLGPVDGGVRGFRDAQVAGARRLVARTEARRVLGRPFGLADFGAAAFVDAGRTWAGDAPYGVTSPMHAAVGLGLLAAVPPASRRLWRLDVALPVTRAPGAGLQLLVSNRDLTRVFWREPGDALRTRARSVPSSIFTWP